MLTLYVPRSSTWHVNTASRPTAAVTFIIGAENFGSGKRETKQIDESFGSFYTFEMFAIYNRKLAIFFHKNRQKVSDLKIGSHFSFYSNYFNFIPATEQATLFTSPITSI